MRKHIVTDRDLVALRNMYVIRPQNNEVFQNLIKEHIAIRADYYQMEVFCDNLREEAEGYRDNIATLTKKVESLKEDNLKMREDYEEIIGRLVKNNKALEAEVAALKANGSTIDEGIQGNYSSNMD